jgi:hypothetical protein
MAERLEFDSTPSPAPAPAGGGRKLEFDAQPKSGGAFAHKEIGVEQELRAEKLKRLLDAKGEPGYGARVLDNFGMGLTRPIGGAMSVLGGEVGEYFGGKPATAGERWRAGVGAEEDYVKRAERNTPGALGVAADVVGGLATGGPGKALVSGAANVIKQAPSTGGKIARWLVGSTGSGAIEGAARNAEDLRSAAIGGGVGGAVGGTVGKAVGAGTKLLPGVRGAQKEVNEAVREGGSAGLKTEGGAIYKKLDDAGIKFAGTETPKLFTDTAQAMADKGFNREVHKELVPILNQIGEFKGKPITWTQLQNIRTQISTAKASDNQQVRPLAKKLGDVLDAFVDTSKPTLPARSVGQIDVGADKTARDLWARGSKAETVEFLSGKGMASTRDEARKLQTNFQTALDRANNPKKFSPFQNDPGQKDMLKGIARGDPRRAQLADWLGRKSDALTTFGGLGLVGGGGASLFDPTGAGSGVGAGGAAALTLGMLGKGGARHLNNTITKHGAERVDDLIRNIVTGSTDRSRITTPREALAKVMAAEQLNRGASRYASGQVSDELDPNRKNNLTRVYISKP